MKSDFQMIHELFEFPQYITV